MLDTNYHQILKDSDESLKRLNELNKSLAKNPYPTDPHFNEAKDSLLIDITEEISIRLKLLNEVVEGAGWWKKKTAQSLIADFIEAFTKLQTILVKR